MTNLLLAAATLSMAHHHDTTSQPTSSLTVFLTSEGRTRHLAATRRVARRKASAKTPVYTVTATAYQAVAGQTDAEPFVTADNSRIKPRYSSKTRWLALSQDLLAQGGGKFQYGDKVRVQGISPALDGVYTVHDTMHRRHRHYIDILTHANEKLDVFTKGVKIRLAGAPPASPMLRKSRARATAAASARLGSSQRRLNAFRSPPPGRKQSNYLASAIL